MTSTSWGGRRRTSAQSTSWGGRRARSVAGLAAAAVTAVPFATAPALAATSPVVVAGPNAVSWAAAHGANVRSGGLDTIAVADVTAAEAALLRARGLAVVPDAPVVLTGDGQAVDEESTRLSVAELTEADETGLDGRGVTVAVVDSGVDEVAGLRGRVVQGADFTGTGMRDRFGHGTFVAGLISGDGTGPNGRRTGMEGVAPEARIVSVKIADRAGNSSVGKLVLGLSWVVTNADRYGIDVVNLSVSTGRALSYHVNPVNALVEAAWFSGLTVVASAGNNGGPVVAAPANDPFAITVGSVKDLNTVSTRDDVRSVFSNDGRTLDGYDKPELTAFGQHVRSTLPEGSVLAGRQRVTGLPAGYGQLSGTSMSAAVVSGVAALLEQATPGITPDQVKGALVGGRKHSAEVVDLGRSLKLRRSTKANEGLRPSVALGVAYAQLVLGTRDYDSVNWDKVRWNKVAWADVTWTDATWTDVARAAATWTNATWTNATWTTATWTTATWTSATWTSATWSE